jgi:hypothetical protein
MEEILMRSQLERGKSRRRGPLTAMLAAAALSGVFITLQSTPGLAQSAGIVAPVKLAREGYVLTKSDAEGIEAALKNKPDDLAARTKLMLSVTYRRPDTFAVDHAALSEAFLNRAQELEPADPRWSSDLEQLRKLRSTANQPK